jgi:large subunit ribosomal protein L5
MKQQTTQLNSTRRELRTFLEKIVVDAGVGRLSQTPNFEEKTLAQVMKDLAAVTGQKPQVRRIQKSIAGFKVREGAIVGLKITLRRDKMVDFFERFITIVLPRVRDFGGIAPTAIDAGGTLNIGVRDHIVFPEIEPEHSPVTFSIGVSVVPRIKNRAKSVEEFKKLGVPLKKDAPSKK